MGRHGKKVGKSLCLPLDCANMDVYTYVQYAVGCARSEGKGGKGIGDLKFEIGDEGLRTGRIAREGL